MRFRLRSFQQRQIVGDGHFQQVVQKALQAGQPPFLGAAEPAQQLRHIAAVVHQHDALLVQREREVVPRAADLLPIGNGQRSRQRVLVDHGLRLLRRVHLHVDQHVKALPLLLPLLRGQRDHVLRAARMDLPFAAGRQELLDQIIHVLPLHEDSLPYSRPDCKNAKAAPNAPGQCGTPWGKRRSDRERPCTDSWGWKSRTPG